MTGTTAHAAGHDGAGPTASDANLVAGRWTRGSGPAGTSADPTTGATLLSFHEPTAEETAAAFDAAHAAAPAWQATSPLARAEALTAAAVALEREAGAFADLIVAEVGKPLREAREEVARGAAILRYHGQAALDPHGRTIPDAAGNCFLYTERAPLGVVGLITPWNFPLAIPLWKLAPALAYGNAVVMKPAPHASLMSRRIAELLLASLPAGTLTVLQGGPAVGAAVAGGPVHGLSFTGSSAAGAAVAEVALRRGARFQGELGGKNASVVLADADLERAAATIVRAAMGFGGQKCTATSRVIVEAPVAERFERLLAAQFAALAVGDPAEERTDVGPLIDAGSVERVSGFVRRAVADGARVAAGGEAIPSLGPTFFAPTLLADVRPDSELAQTEVFGPVLALMTARDADEALALANGTEYGLAAAVFTRDLQAALRFARTLDASSVRVNGPTPGVPFNAPFGPWKTSGIGLAEQGKAAQDFYTRERTVTVAID